MKRCPTCQSTYTDDTLLYCLTDGATLIDSAAFDPQATLPNDFQSTLGDEGRRTMPDDDRATLLYPAIHSTDQPPAAAPNVNPPQREWRPAPAWGAPAPPYQAPLARQRSNYVAWILGAAIVVVVGVVITIIIATRSSDDEKPGANNSNIANRNAGQNVNNSPSPTPSGNVNQNAGGNTNQGGTVNGNSNQSQGGETKAPPTDSELVLSQLTSIENEWNDANIKGNKATVRRIVADEFRGVGANGSVENKDQMLANMKPAPQIASLKLSDLKVSLAGNTAVITGLNTATLKPRQILKFRFTDTFIWREGRWQAISSQASQVK